MLQAVRVGARFIWEVLVERADPEAHDVLLLAAADIWAVSDELASQVTDSEVRTRLLEMAGEYSRYAELVEARETQVF